MRTTVLMDNKSMVTIVIRGQCALQAKFVQVIGQLIGSIQRRAIKFGQLLQARLTNCSSLKVTIMVVCPSLRVSSSIWVSI